MDKPKNNHVFPHYQPFPFKLSAEIDCMKQTYPSYEIVGLDACARDMNEKEFIDFMVKEDFDRMVIEVPTSTYPLITRMLHSINQVCDVNIAVFGDIYTIKQDTDSFYHCGLVSQIHPENIVFDRTDFPNEQYSNFEFHRPSAQVLTSFACRNNCGFCTERNICYKPYFRIMDYVMDELNSLKDQVKQYHFDDMNIASSEKHVTDLCNRMVKEDVNLPWTCLTDIKVPEETIKLMNESGCVGISFGVESFDPLTLALINKNHVSYSNVQAFLKLLDKYNIHGVATYQIGLPQTATSIIDTVSKAIDLCREFSNSSLQFSIATPFPGTRFHKMCKDHGWLSDRDYTFYDGSRYSVIDYPFLFHSEIEGYHEYAMKQREESNVGFRRK